MVKASVGFSKKIGIALFKNLDALTTSYIYRELVPFFINAVTSNVLPPSVSRKYFGHLRVMLPCLDCRVEMSLICVKRIRQIFRVLAI